MTNIDFNDDIGFGGDDLEQVLAAPARVAPQAPAQEPQLFWKGCGRCGGTGRYGNFGQCFACQGTKGKYLKTAPEARAKARVQAEVRKVRTETENVEAFQAAFPAEWLWLCDRVKWELTKATGGQDFGQSLLRTITKFGDLTEKQLAAVRTNLAKRAAAAEQRVATAPKIDVARIEVAFATAAAAGLQRLKLRLATTTPEGTLRHAFTFTPAPATGKNPGATYVKEGDEYLGKVVAGVFRCVATCGDERRDDVVTAASDPAQAAIAYGKLLGECAICARTLSDPESVARGIGPVCAERYGF